jgi:sucrose-6-phosphate hydrolase SacC (GH32 family)
MRPRYHYAPAANWLSDPNGLIHHAGEWHMFYQYNPQGEDWGHMAWGHAVSPDLAHWQELPPALIEEDGVMIYSGSAVTDHANTAGFGAEALVAIYTGANHAENRQTQCLASSTDGGRAFTKFAGNPVLDLRMADFRDPNVFWHAPSGQWIMVVVLSTENRASIYASTDLKSWSLCSHIETSGAPGHLWECPLLIELPVEGTGETRWMFKVDVLSGAPGSGALYRVGAFDGFTFVPQSDWQISDLGNDFYAAIAWHEPRDAAGRPCWIGWMGNHAYQAKLPHQGWRGAMSMPRRLSLVRSSGTLTLRQDVEPSTLALFGPASDIMLGLQPRELPLASRCTIPAQGPFEIAIDADDGRSMLLERDSATLRVSRHDPVTPELNRVCELTLPDDAGVDLWIDFGSIEVIGAGGIAALTMQHRMSGDSVRFRAASAVKVAFSPL